jgi:hypothetical protein
MLLEAYDKDASSWRMTHGWFICFRNIRTSVDDDKRSGHPST